MKKTSFDRFHTLLNYFTTRLNWENFYELEDGGKCGNVGWAYSLILLSRYGDVPRESEFYSLKLMRAFEPKLWQMQQEHKEGRLIDLFHRAYSFRFFDCFANWFGLVNIEYKKTHRVFPFREMMISRSVLFDQLFTVVKKS